MQATLATFGSTLTRTWCTQDGTCQDERRLCVLPQLAELCRTAETSPVQSNAYPPEQPITRSSGRVRGGGRAGAGALCVCVCVSELRMVQ